ncbi:hypothetical protein HK100_000713, partial [Physocladia obscura]
MIALHAVQFEATHPKSTVIAFDTHSFLMKVLNNPSQYGIVNTTRFCTNYSAVDIATNYASYGCLPINKYFWYNTGHITYRVHELIAQEVEKFLIRK